MIHQRLDVFCLLNTFVANVTIEQLLVDNFISVLAQIARLYRALSTVFILLRLGVTNDQDLGAVVERVCIVWITVLRPKLSINSLNRRKLATVFHHL